MMAYLSFKLWSTPTAAAGLEKLQKAQCHAASYSESESTTVANCNKQGEPVLYVHAFVKTISSSASLQPKYLWKMISLLHSNQILAEEENKPSRLFFLRREKKRKNKQTATPLKIFCNSLSHARLGHS
jgi:hypothetical protein